MRGEQGGGGQEDPEGREREGKDEGQALRISRIKVGRCVLITSAYSVNLEMLAVSNPCCCLNLGTSGLTLSPESRNSLFAQFRVHTDTSVANCVVRDPECS